MRYPNPSEQIEMFRINRRTDWITVNELRNQINKIRRQFVSGYINRDEYESERANIVQRINIVRSCANTKSRLIVKFQRMS